MLALAGSWEQRGSLGEAQQKAKILQVLRKPVKRVPPLTWSGAPTERQRKITQYLRVFLSHPERGKTKERQNSWLLAQWNCW